MWLIQDGSVTVVARPPDAIDLGKQGADLVMSRTKPSRAHNAENRRNYNQHPQ